MSPSPPVTTSPSLYSSSSDFISYTNDKRDDWDKHNDNSKDKNDNNNDEDNVRDGGYSGDDEHSSSEGDSGGKGEKPVGLYLVELWLYIFHHWNSSHKATTLICYKTGGSCSCYLVPGHTWSNRPMNKSLLQWLLSGRSVLSNFKIVWWYKGDLAAIFNCSHNPKIASNCCMFT